MHFQGTYFCAPLTEIHSDETLIKAQVIDDVMFCYCPVDSCAYLWVRSVLMAQPLGWCMWECFCCTHMLSACNDDEAVGCRPYHRRRKKRIKKKTDMKDPDACKKGCVTFFHPRSMNMISIDVNELELICLKSPLKMNWYKNLCIFFMSLWAILCFI